jgi:hypothetical protein
MKKRFFVRSNTPQGTLAIKVETTTKPSYEERFMNPSGVKARTGKTAYIRKEYHERIMKIVQVIGENNYTMFDYLDNVLTAHFSEYKDDITTLYRERNTDVF